MRSYHNDWSIDIQMEAKKEIAKSIKQRKEAEKMDYDVDCLF